MNYHCPYCSRKKDIKAQCRLEEETRAKKEAEQRAKERMEKEKEDRGKADSVAGAAYEFWTLMGEIMDELNNEDNLTDSMLELPVPSPDSITVTTVFGVSEEPNNVTVITAGPGPAPSSAEIEEVSEQEAQQEELIEDAVLPDNTTAPPVALDLSIEVEAEEMADDEGDDADFNEDDFDAESALIDEFIDDGVLTPTTVTTA